MRSAPRRAAPTPLVVLGALGLLAVLVTASLAVGSRDLPPTQVWDGLLARDGSRASIIVWQLRLPRTVLAVLVGAALAVAGTLMSALTRNPLAEPGLLGVNAGASVTVVIAIATLGVTGGPAVLACAVLGAAVAAAFVAGLALRHSGRSDHARLVLAGAALSASLSAITGVVTLSDPRTFTSYRYWVIGSVAERGPDALGVAPVVLAGLLLAAVCARSLDAVALGDDQASALGVGVGTTRVLVLGAVTLLCGSATAAAGPISFVGLVVPHVLRRFVGPDQRRLLGLSLLAGPALVLASDVLGRVVARPGELEVGIVTAFVGAPLLLALLVRGSRR